MTLFLGRRFTANFLHLVVAQARNGQGTGDEVINDIDAANIEKCADFVTGDVHAILRQAQHAVAFVTA